MDEKVFFEEGSIKVTNSRFIAGAQTYAMSGVTSVRSAVHLPKRTGIYILGGVGLLMLVGGAEIAGILALGIAVALWFVNKPKYSVALTSASGETDAHLSPDQDLIARIVNAINEAIIHRG
jgi:hypothetical protein